MNRVLLLLALLLASSGEVSATSRPDFRGAKSATSPDGRNTIRLAWEEHGLGYTVLRDGEVLIQPSRLGLRFKKSPRVQRKYKPLGSELRSIDETWQPVWGQQAEIRNRCEELTVHCEEPGRRFDLIFRAYDDGVAFRYRFTEPEDEELVIISELTRFRFPENPITWSIPADYDSYERIYRRLPLDEFDAGNTPITLELESGEFVSLHEANLTDYAGMTLAAPRTEPGTLECDLVPWPNGDKVRTRIPFETPWRTIQIADTPGELLESTMILNLNEPCVIEDTSWIRPMTYMGIWWGMHIGKETWFEGPKHGATTENTIRHLDFAADHGIGGLLVEGWNTGWKHWGGKDAFDFVTPYDDFDLPAVAAHAREVGVALIGHHETGGDVPSYEKRLEEAFSLYRDHGITGVKTGYAGGIYPRGHHHHGQWMVRHYRHVVERAAEYRLMIDAHEPIKPTGISRTWPNMMTREGVRGTEYNAWSEGNPPEHETILPFTRMLAGPADYTPGIFDLRFDRYKPDHQVRTTLAKQLALLVLLYSPLQMAADLPENYEGHPAFAFVEDLPTTWDETRAPLGAIGDYAGVVRRSGDEWWAGVVTDEEARRLELPLDFLDPGLAWRAHIYRDSADSHWDTAPRRHEIVEQSVHAGETLILFLAPGGGQAIRFTSDDH
jgi:alpha-glucosidase